MENAYNRRYSHDIYYWGTKPSPICFRVLELLPPGRRLRLLDIGCGEGRNAVFFARNGYHVTAFDSSPQGVEKTGRLAAEAGVPLEVFEGDINAYRLSEPFDVVFSVGVLQYIPEELRQDILCNYREFTTPGGLNVFSVFVTKPFVPKAPDAEATSHKWISGEILTYYHDWKTEMFVEEVFNCMSSGVPHQHAVNRIVARRPVDGHGS